MAFCLLRVTPKVAASQGTTADPPRLVVFDRKGNIVSVVTEPGLYSQPIFSSDRKRLAVIKIDPQTQNQDIWAIDLSTGKSTQVTSDPAPEMTPVWSPDDSQIAYVAAREGTQNLYRRSSSGTGGDELLYRHNGFGGVMLTDWLTNGSLRFLDAINISGAFYELPLGRNGPATEILRPTFYPVGARISPDSRFIAYLSNQSGRYEVYVRPFRRFFRNVTAPADDPRRVSNNGGRGMISWGQGGKKLYYLSADLGVMEVDVTAADTFRAGRPRRLFRAPNAILAPAAGGPNALATMSSDGERFAFALPPATPLGQLTLLDERGQVVRTIGDPDLYYQPSLSSDGMRVAVVHYDIGTGNQDIWTFDVSTANSTVVTSDSAPDSAPVWSPDGNRIAYVSNRPEYIGIFLKSWNGSGREELLYKLTPGIGSMVLTDWSTDGRFLSFYAGDVLYALPLNGGGAIELVRSEFSAVGGRFSPDGRLVAYLSNESGKNEVYVQPFDGRSPTQDSEKRWQVSHDGAQGMIFWREDGKAVGYLASNGTVMMEDIDISQGDLHGKPHPLFRQATAVSGGPYNALQNAPQLRNVSRNNRLFVFAVPQAALPTAR
jgi:Tol biopolymer transport system component